MSDLSDIFFSWLGILIFTLYDILNRLIINRFDLSDILVSLYSIDRLFDINILKIHTHLMIPTIYAKDLNLKPFGSN